ncbi:hypothetical protein OAG48_00715 [bacterium]|nr:hypothetical protein [bacterium]
MSLTPVCMGPEVSWSRNETGGGGDRVPAGILSTARPTRLQDLAGSNKFLEVPSERLVAGWTDAILQPVVADGLVRGGGGDVSA